MTPQEIPVNWWPRIAAAQVELKLYRLSLLRQLHFAPAVAGLLAEQDYFRLAERIDNLLLELESELDH